MTGRSSHSLFHFTRSREALLSILRGRFFPRFCLEQFGPLLPRFGSISEFELAIPMVCFCDIPLAQTGYHVETYGSYGVGMDPSWAREWGISPVIYADSSSETVRAIDRAGGFIGDEAESGGNSEAVAAARDELLALFAFLKPYSGPLWRDGAQRGTVRFYDEREWRFVPRNPGSRVQILSRPELDDVGLRTELEQGLISSGPRFGLQDVRHILVRREDEVDPTINDLLATSSLTDMDERALSRRVLSVERIRQDF